MTFEEFREKLIPFFTPAQIGRLDTEAIQSALDGLETPHNIDELREIASAGRELICVVIADYIETDPAFIEKLAGDAIPWERRKALIMQIDKEW